jgi:hypothetical protein
MVNGRGWAGWREGVWELRLRKLQLCDPLFSGQGTVAPSFPTAFDFLASLS